MSKSSGGGVVLGEQGEYGEMYATEGILLVDRGLIRCKNWGLFSRYAGQFVSDCSQTLYEDGGVGVKGHILMVKKQRKL